MAVSKGTNGGVTIGDEDKVVVFFYSEDQSSLISKRRVILTASCPVLRIGRSSKVQSKGFIPADDNAWFDNPVMSREHAEISAKFDEKPFSVFLKDVGSFHGTFIRKGSNEEQLIQHEPTKLKDDDIIRFGVDILRADKTYPPCSVRFKMERIEAPIQKLFDSPRRGFTVPDDVDDEEDERCENEGASSDTVSKPTPALNVSVSKNVLPINKSTPSFVDLTVDNELPSHITFPTCSDVKNCNISSDVIDLTSEANCESDVEPCTVDRTIKRWRRTPMPVASDISARQCHAGSMQTSEKKIVDLLSFTVPSDDEAMFSKYHDDSIDEDDESESDVGDHSKSLSTSPLLSESDMDEGSDSGSSNADSTLSDLEDGITYRYRGDESNDDGISELRYPYDSSDDSSFNDEEEEKGEDEDESESESESESVDGDDDASTESSGGRLSTPYSPYLDQPTTPAPNVLQLTPSAPPFNPLHGSYNRDPSPSDAALIKCRRPLLDNVPNESRAQQLGEKTGNPVYFLAREQNRTVLSPHDEPAPISAIRETLQAAHPRVTAVAPEAVEDSGSPSPSLSCAVEEERDTLIEAKSKLRAIQAKWSKVAQDASEAADAISIKLGDTDTNQYSAWTVSGDNFINKPPTEETSVSQTIRFFQPGELDMTSAYKFQQSKQVMQPSAETRRLPIQDLLSQDLLSWEPESNAIENMQELRDSAFSAPEPATDSHVNLTSTPNKRSYEEAFHENDNESSELHETSSSSQPEEHVTHEKPNTPATQTKVPAHDVSSAVVAAQAGTFRPTKRMRLAAAVKVAACVALGGAATFSYLVNTAPVF